MFPASLDPEYGCFRKKVKTSLFSSFYAVQEVYQEPAQSTTDEKVFTIKKEPVPQSACVYKNGLLMREGTGHDYTINGNEIEFAEKPETGSVILVNYKHE
jgi:hypothetical protein